MKETIGDNLLELVIVICITVITLVGLTDKIKTND